MGNFGTRSMNSNNAISYSLVALRTDPTISHFDPLALQHHQLSPNLIFLRLADLANNLGIEYWRTKRFY